MKPSDQLLIEVIDKEIESLKTRLRECKKRREMLMNQIQYERERITLQKHFNRP